LYVDGIGETFAWLLELGLVFEGPFEEPPHRVPRMHLALPNAESYIKRLLKAMRKHRVRIVTGARLEELIFADDRGVGVVARAGGDPETALDDVAGSKLQIRAAKGVVLATGDFSASQALKDRFVGQPRSGATAINPLSTGDGHLVATRHGAQVLNGHVVWGPELRFPKPPSALWARQLPDWPWLVKAAHFGCQQLPSWLTKRFMAEFLSSFMGPSPGLFEAGALLVDEHGNPVADRSPDALGLKGEGEPFWIVFDSAIAERFESWPGYVSTAPGIAYAYLDDYRRMRPDVTHQAPTLEALAGKIGWPDPGKVMAAFKPSAAKPPRGPFYALGPAYSMIPFTDGGLAVSPKMEVLGEDEKPIAGLFAAGSAGQGGLILNGHGHHIGWAFVSGRIAGAGAAYC
jgi:fumarate reductase flavoprotein subunit